MKKFNPSSESVVIPRLTMGSVRRRRRRRRRQRIIIHHTGVLRTGRRRLGRAPPRVISMPLLRLGVGLDTQAPAGAVPPGLPPAGPAHQRRGAPPAGRSATCAPCWRRVAAPWPHLRRRPVGRKPRGDDGAVTRCGDGATPPFPSTALLTQQPQFSNL